jgi:hypothetical protein
MNYSKILPNIFQDSGVQQDKFIEGFEKLRSEFGLEPDYAAELCEKSYTIGIPVSKMFQVIGASIRSFNAGGPNPIEMIRNIKDLFDAFSKIPTEK